MRRFKPTIGPPPGRLQASNPNSQAKKLVMARPRARTCVHGCSFHCSRRAARILLRGLSTIAGASEIGGEMTSKQETNEMAFQYKLVSVVVVVVFCLAVCAISGSAQTTGNSSLSGVVADPSGAVVPGATVEIHNPVSQFDRSTTTDGAGRFSFPNVPFNPYHLRVNLTGFAAYSQDIDVRSAVPLALKITLQIAGSSENVMVQGEAGDLLENDPTFHTDVDRSLFSKLPLESTSSELSSLVTLASPGVAADSNGLFHGMGDHASNSFSLDGQPITDQQSKVFSNQIPLDAVQSMTVISGAPPAEFGDKTSLVIDVTTRSGLGSTTPHGDITASYGTFGSSNVDFNFSYGGKNWGNFIAANGLNTGRFLDPPEFVVFHAHGNEENVFDRFDYQFSPADVLHFNFGFTRSWFQNPNSYDNLNLGVQGPDGGPVGPTDQRSKILTYNIAPTWAHTIGANAVLNVTGYVRRDQYNYYPSANPFADFGPIQSETVAQDRTLTNAGAIANIAYTTGIHNVKAGVMYEQTFLNENDTFGIVNPTLNSPCVDANGNPVSGFTDPSQCAAAGLQPNTSYTPLLGCYDLTRPSPSPSSGCQSPHSTLFSFLGHTDVKELAMYVQDNITKRNWTVNLGIRGDFYNGLTVARQAEPRLGVSYNVQKTNTILRVSYARTLETPFNENLVLSSTGCNFAVIAAIVPCVPAPLTPGWALRASVPVYHGFSALVVMSSVAARFFPPQTSGLGVTVGQSGTPFRIDHDEAFNQTTHLQYQTPWKRGSWIGFNWRYDSGLVAGAVPCYGVLPFNNCPTSTMLNGQPAVDLSGLTADQEFQAGIFCGSVRATPFSPVPTPCLASQYGSNLVKIPAPNTQNDDHNPARIASRNLFDLAIGDDNLFKGDRKLYRAYLLVKLIAVT